MDTQGWVIVAVVLFAIWLSTARRGYRVPYSLRQKSFPYHTRTSILNRSEMAFFIEMEKRLPRGFYLFPKVRIIDFLDVEGPSGYSIWKKEVWAKHVDFLVCDINFKPMVAIEINGKSHQAIDRGLRDAFVNKALQAAELRLETVAVGSSFAESAERVAAGLVGVKG